jgi:hypothetical protein
MTGLTSGIYDHLISEKLRLALGSLDLSVSCAHFEKLEEPLSADYLTRFLRARIHQALSIVKHDQRLDLANQLLNSLAAFDKDLTFLSAEKVDNLTEILNQISPLNREKFLRPTTSPTSPSLFTGS